MLADDKSPGVLVLFANVRGLYEMCAAACIACADCLAYAFGLRCAVFLALPTSVHL